MDVFLSYRRSDTPSATGRLADRLQAALGAEHVFRDLDSIAPGADFEAALARAIGGAGVLLAVIGPHWLSASHAGSRRLDDAADMVRREIEAAFRAGVPVVPVLVEGAHMPTASDLPSSLAAFARCQAVELSDARWGDDCVRLLGLLRRHHGITPDLVEPSPPMLRPAQLLLDALELLARPRRVILRVTSASGRGLLAHASLLLVICLAVSNLLVGAAVGDIGLLGWVFNGTLISLLAAAFLVGVIGLGWRVAGARAGLQTAVAGAACLVGGASIYFGAGLVVVVIGMLVSDPSIFKRLLADLRSGEWSPASMPTTVDAPVQPAVLTAVVFATVAWAAGLVWLAAAWNALRVALLRPWWAAVAALAVVVAVLGALAQAARWAALA